MMPLKTGIECLREIKRNASFSAIPVIMYSNSVGDEYIAKCYKSGADYFFRKGIYPELTESISKLLANLGENAQQTSEERFVFRL